MLQLAQSWLLRLLVAAAREQVGAMGSETPQGGDAARMMALLPALPEDSAQSTPEPADLGFRCWSFPPWPLLHPAEVCRG